MGSRFTNLDESGVLEAPRTVRIRGTDYQLPGDIPAALFVRVQAVASAGEDATPEQAEAVYAELLGVFRDYQPDLERLPLGLNEMVLAIGIIYGEGDEDGADGAAPPTGTPTTPKPKPRRASTSKKSRSSRSSAA